MESLGRGRALALGLNIFELVLATRTSFLFGSTDTDRPNYNARCSCTRLKDDQRGTLLANTGPEAFVISDSWLYAFTWSSFAQNSIPNNKLVPSNLSVQPSRISSIAWLLKFMTGFLMLS